MKILQLIALEYKTFWQKLFRTRRRILAEVYVEDGQIKVESQYPEVKKQILDFIKVREEMKPQYQYGYRRGRMEGDTHILEMVSRKITDPDFLRAFSDTLHMGDRELGSYDWYPRDIER